MKLSKQEYRFLYSVLKSERYEWELLSKDNNSPIVRLRLSTIEKLMGKIREELNHDYSR